MAIDRGTLEAITAKLDDVLASVEAQAAQASDDDDVGLELREIARQLETASRRLAAAAWRMR